MPRRAGKALTEAQILAILASAEYRDKTQLERGVDLVIEHQVGISAASRATGVSRKAIGRALKPRTSSKVVGRNGRPPAISQYCKIKFREFMIEAGKTNQTITLLAAREKLREFYIKEPHADLTKIPSFCDNTIRKLLLETNCRLVRPSKLESCRVLEATSVDHWYDEQIERFGPCEHLERLLSDRYDTSLIADMDETFLNPGEKDIKAIWCREAPRPTRPDPKHPGEHITLAMAITASGKKLKPFLIFPRATMPDLPDSAAKYAVGGSDNGWITAVLFLEWLELVFGPYIAKCRQKLGNPTARALLVMDNHATHQSDDIRAWCEKHLVDTLYLLPHATHLMQPLDVAVFGPFKATLSTRYRNLEAQAPKPDPCHRWQTIHATVEAVKATFQESFIWEGWRKSGLVPFNPQAYKGEKGVVESPARPLQNTRGPSINQTILLPEEDGQAPKGAPARKTPARKTPARKTPARKTPARKTPARKTPARRAPAKRATASEPTCNPPGAPTSTPPLPPPTPFSTPPPMNGMSPSPFGACPLAICYQQTEKVMPMPMIPVPPMYPPPYPYSPPAAVPPLPALFPGPAGPFTAVPSPYATAPHFPATPGHWASLRPMVMR
ncbi:hypothetical protein PAPYR_7505 [Paratrimastix pyriformis]|uniref:DDE-1 domain-containing protein n=1 Tax=Paratrimastix pyriformis TaxID=342808 RepID=A0ABQ8UK10_9EUKA|nr:hypothetical protein PAPYR_7505 [Paratrimastix pyriformis]